MCIKPLLQYSCHHMVYDSIILCRAIVSPPNVASSEPHRIIEDRKRRPGKCPDCQRRALDGNADPSSSTAQGFTPGLQSAASPPTLAEVHPLQVLRSSVRPGWRDLDATESARQAEQQRIESEGAQVAPRTLSSRVPSLEEPPYWRLDQPFQIPPARPRTPTRRHQLQTLAWIKVQEDLAAETAKELARKEEEEEAGNEKDGQGEGAQDHRRKGKATEVVDMNKQGKEARSKDTWISPVERQQCEQANAGAENPQTSPTEVCPQEIHSVHPQAREVPAADAIRADSSPSKKRVHSAENMAASVTSPRNRRPYHGPQQAAGAHYRPMLPSQPAQARQQPGSVPRQLIRGFQQPALGRQQPTSAPRQPRQVSLQPLQTSHAPQTPQRLLGPGDLNGPSWFTPIDDPPIDPRLFMNPGFLGNMNATAGNQAENADFETFVDSNTPSNTFSNPFPQMPSNLGMDYPGGYYPNANWRLQNRHALTEDVGLNFSFSPDTGPPGGMSFDQQPMFEGSLPDEARFSGSSFEDGSPIGGETGLDGGDEGLEITGMTRRGVGVERDAGAVEEERTVGKGKGQGEGEETGDGEKGDTE